MQTGDALATSWRCAGPEPNRAALDPLAPTRCRGPVRPRSVRPQSRPRPGAHARRSGCAVRRAGHDPGPVVRMFARPYLATSPRRNVATQSLLGLARGPTTRRVNRTHS